ncbi:heme o synthase [Jeotgalibacillus salarius]|uniref:Protoheme IX farnesyltransferase n=1 Tax=Jeotgalibacillus salarius TaxID=546023 RepID=A0A4Y8LDA0_9BACL|nr:heme o synthase [Jeotgalibacillus salarius]TFE00272.1 protoheme IX farnesyltransferase [Jeotgalibacillus salarius]
MSNSRVVSAVNGADFSGTTAWKDFLALIKIGIVNSNFITAFTGLWLALYFTDTYFLGSLDVMFLALLGSSLVVAGSCSINNYIDRDIDPLMERTKNRPTVTGRVAPTKALGLGISLVIVGEIMLFMTTVTAGLIGLFGVFSYVVLYSMWTKRKYASNTIVGSISGAVPPLIGWAAIDPGLGAIPFALFLIMFVWQPPHFYAIAMRRVEEYRAAGIPMLPVVKGFARTKLSMLLWVIALFPLPFLLPSLGTAFIVLATILNVGWLALALAGYKTKNDHKWATMMFVYSLNYLTIMFTGMVILTFI